MRPFNLYRLVVFFVIFILIAVITALLSGFFSYPYRNVKLPVEKRVEDLLRRMTLDEKLGQMIQAERGTATPEEVKKRFIGSILNGGGSTPGSNNPADWCDMIDAYQQQALKTRLKIPIIYGTDAVHGHNNVRGATIFPHNIGLGATRDPGLMERIGKIVAMEMRATGVHWTFAPCVAVPQNERWGRTYEGFSEDPKLVSLLGDAFIKGVQGANYPDDLKEKDKALACLKHFIGDGATTNGKNAGDALLTEEEIRSIHLPPFVSGIKAGAGTVMISFNSINGLECHENYHLITDILKNELNFQGFVITDWEGIDGNDPDYRTAVKEAINAGIDMLMVPNRWMECLKKLKDLVAKKEIPMSRIDDAVRRILRVKLQLGLFESPFTDRSFIKDFGSQAHRDVAREAVRKSLVLLKNEQNILPLPKEGHKILVAGKCADNIGYQCGGWTVRWQGGSGGITTGTSILEGIRGVASGNTITFSVDGTGAAGHDVAIVVIGETPYAEGMGDRLNLNLDGRDLATLMNVQESGVPMVVVLVSGRPMIITEWLPEWEALVTAWLPGSEGRGVAEVLFGEEDFTGRLPFIWPREFDQLPISPGDGQEPLFEMGYGLRY